MANHLSLANRPLVVITLKTNLLRVALVAALTDALDRKRNGDLAVAMEPVRRG